MLKKAYNYLSDYGIRPSAQRIAVMEYLLENRTHPTADRIYAHLVSRIPTLSRMTVYNTLSLLADHGAVIKLDIDGERTHWDGDTSPHAHFMCTNCGAIHDIFPETEGWHRLLSAAPPPPGASISDTQLSYKGLCEKCNKTDNNNDITN